MYHKDFYRNLLRHEIRASVENEGFSPLIITNRPGYIYPPHSYPETKLIVVLQGSMSLKIEDALYACLPTDKIIIPGNVQHSAIVGKSGCTFFWSEKIL